MKKIPLTKGAFALVDDEDYEKLIKHKWYLNTEGYAVRDIFFNKRRKNIRMHRFIMKTPEGMDTDHINGNRLDNRKLNLRICTRSENLRNSSVRSDSKSGYKGVSFFKPVSMWRAYINKDKKQISLGYFSTPEEAAKAYNKAAKEYFSEFALLNDV